MIWLPIYVLTKFLPLYINFYGCPVQLRLCHYLRDLTRHIISRVFAPPSPRGTVPPPAARCLLSASIAIMYSVQSTQCISLRRPLHFSSLRFVSYPGDGPQNIPRRGSDSAHMFRLLDLLNFYAKKISYPFIRVWKLILIYWF